MKTFIFLFLSSVIMTVGSCHKENLNPDGDKIIDLDEKSVQLVEADNAFGLEIFHHIRDDGGEENILISPLSISMVLAMAYNGAEGTTKTEMEQTLHLKGLTTEEINTSYRLLIEALQSLDDEVLLEIANALFYSGGFSPRADFLSINRNIYNAEVESLNFGSDEAVEIINDWVADKTNQKITRIIENLDPLDRMVLLNAIYFKGIWSNPFDEEGTHTLIFHKSDDTSLEVPMMNKLEKLGYTSNNLFKAIKMPYGNGQYNMIVILPAEGYNTQDVIDELSATNWKSWMKSFELTDRVNVTMPRFKFAYETGLKELLKKMGMEKAFLTEIADFSGITDEDLYISSIKHKSFIDVNETGTEAAAVTAAVFTTTGIDSGPPVIPFFVNKPFVFAITENDTEAILFIGEVNHPEYN